MWRTLLAISKGRAILLTTHSMEESSALATRVGIMARRMLALGTIDQLRKVHGDAYYVHLVSKTAPHSTSEEMGRLRSWVLDQFPSADVDQQTYNGQMRFRIPANPRPEFDKGNTEVEIHGIKGGSRSEVTLHDNGISGIGSIIAVIEFAKERLGIEAFSVSPTTLDAVFLNIVQKYNVEEEGYQVHTKLNRGKWIWVGRTGKSAS